MTNFSITKSWAVVLFFSVTLNLFFVGMVVSRWMVYGQDSMTRWGGMHGMRIAEEQLQGDSRKKVVQIRQQYSLAIHQQMRAVRQARQEFQQQLLAETLDPPRIQKAMEELDKRSRVAKGNIHAIMIQVAEALPYEDRKIYFEHLSARHTMGRHRWEPSQASGKQGE